MLQDLNGGHGGSAAAGGKKSYFMDKSSFLKNFSPERESEGGRGAATITYDLNLSNNNNNLASTSERDKSKLFTGGAVGHNKLHSSLIDSHGNLDSLKMGCGGGPFTTTTIIQTSNHKIHLRLLDKMMKDKLKNLKTKEGEADELSRRRHH